MTFDRNPDRAIRGPSGRLALVRSVLDSPAGTQEADWIEWKSAVDLTEARWKFSLGKHVLGLRNRMPERAERAAEGCGYVLFGVEPQNLSGITVHDGADVESWVSAYVGTDGPSWDLDYVPIDGKHVLVVTVDPPKYGDPIFALRRGFDNFQPGTVFVRRLGKTEQANPDELAALSRRLMASEESLDIDISLVQPDEVRPLSVRPEDVDGWVAAERARLLKPIPVMTKRQMLGMQTFFAESRSEPEYREEVERYLEQVRKEMQQRAELAVVSDFENEVIFGVANKTARNYSALEVELFIQGNVRAYFDEEEVRPSEGFTKPPPIWGTSRMIAPLTVPLVNYGVSAFHGGSVTNLETSTDIRFPAVDLRPHGSEILHRVFLIVDATPTVDALTARWRATSTNVDGVVTGEFQIPVGASPFSVLELVPPEGE